MPRFRKVKGQSSQVEAVVTLLEYSSVTPDLICKNCLNCDNWSMPLQKCEKFNQTPPPNVICYACPEWKNEADEIPF